ncbi:MAG: GMC family oxidoreductase [Ilumatobacter sp.]|uniref:FAD-dependent oxidoreductase n=1 Tax=Ilumatobacter sp. TaxID=1967498 RepID=UPI0026202582|nr:GMC family oxidoreductase [Ilumatobacter sp.]MDJ0767310.1 GMC family oxidoreductase [Ilumatobacter sp.]
MTGLVDAAPHHDCEVLVVGSGAGGATTAALLAEAGIDVLVIEEGPWIEQGSVVPFSLEQMDRQYRSGGLTVALGRPSIAYTEGRCAGGGTEINSGLYRRPVEATLERWRRTHGVVDFSDEEFYAACDEIEAALSVGRVPGRHSPAGDRLRRGAAALGWQHEEIPRWMTYPTSTDAVAGRRESMTRTFLPRAFAAGARMLCEHRVDRLIHDGDRAFRAELTRPDGTPATVDFRDVILCAGAIQTPALLQRSGHRGLVGRSLAVHPTVKLAARFDDDVNVPDHVPVHQVNEFAPDLSFGGSASHPGLVALALTDHWDLMRGAVTDWRRMAVYYAAITSEGRGRVTALPGLRDPVVTYRLTRRDRALLGKGLARLALVMLEAGAEAVFPSFRGAPVVRTRSDLADLTGRFAAGTASVMTVHLCSTVPMGSDRSRAAADSHGRIHDTANVYVNDASLLPDAPGVNPQGSVMAVAMRNARRFVEERA